MKIPKEIYVKGQHYEIIKVKELSETDGSDGETSEHDKTIKYCSKLNNDKLKRAILHEIGHAIQYETGISQALSEEMQEVVTENFANVIVDLFHLRFK